MSVRTLAVAMLVLIVPLLFVISSPMLVDGLTPSVYHSPDGVYTYLKSGSTSVDYASEILGLDECNGTVEIQSALEGYPLRTITSLSGCMVDVLIVPSSVTSISDTAFSECKSLSKVYFLGDRPSLGASAVPEGVEIFALEGAKGWDADIPVLDLLECSDADFSISYYVIDGEATIHGLIAGTQITIPAEISGVPVVSIGAEAFRGSGISSLTVDDGVRTIGVRAFYDCESLLEAVFPGSLRTICDEAFRNDIHLANVDLRAIEFIGFESFRMCYAFTEIIIPDTVTKMRGGAFYVCDSVGRIVVGSGLPVIEERAFGYEKELSDLTMKGTITSIGDSAFYGCASLGSISLANVTEIGPYAFYGATALSDIDFGKGLTAIGDGAFWNCQGLRIIRMPDTLKVLGKDAFSECSSLKDIFFDGEMPSMGKDVFYGTNVTVHYLSSNSASWKDYDGNAVVEADQGMEFFVTAVIIIVVIVMILIIIIYLLKGRHR